MRLACYLEEKPSYPYCAEHGDVATGHMVTLTCHSVKGSPSPTYTWTRLEQGISKPVMGNTGVFVILMQKTSHILMSYNNNNLLGQLANVSYFISTS